MINSQEVENQILTKQLLLIIENLGALYVSNPDVMTQLRDANKILQEGKINESAESLHVN